MDNIYKDIPDFKFHLNNPMMKKIVGLKERNFEEKDKYDYAPQNFEDAMDNYNRILELAGEICSEIIAPNAESIDIDKPHVKNGHVVYAPGTSVNLEALNKAGLMGMTLPRKFNGLNFPIVPYVMCADMVSACDAGFVNIWGLQDCAETINEFASDEQREKFLPRVCAGETMAMDLTEPDAGSDLQSVMLKASFDEKDNCWYLNGVKRFITNGDGDIALVLARSEEGTHDGRGLSMFIYDKKNGGVSVRRIENKMGIKGSPTCELVFKNAKAELCGSRRLGLIKYVMSLMNGARLGIIAQSVGISQAAFNEAMAYAKERCQFGKAIINFPAISEILGTMKAKLDASRTILYETARFVDLYKCYESISKERKLTPEERKEMKLYNKFADALTPVGKALTSEFCNQNAYDAIQVHGGSGFMKDYACERIYRDARITSIYEGTTQLQIVAAIRHVTTGTYLTLINNYKSEIEVTDKNKKLLSKLEDITSKYETAVDKVHKINDKTTLDLESRRLVEMAGYIIMSYLLLMDSARDERYFSSAKLFIRYAEGEINKNATIIADDNEKSIDNYDFLKTFCKEA